jgi:hypothetical protein
MKYLSFSIWGDKPIYNVGIIRNAELWKSIYPDWKMIVYYDNTVPKETVEILNSLDVLTIKIENFDYGCFWRFFASDIPDCEYVIFRDADSRINDREKEAVDEWIKSKKSIHVMRDHPYHGVPAGNNQIGILAGMWGIKGNIIPITEMIKKFVVGKHNSYGIDQTFLKTIYSIFQEDRLTHDDFFEKKPFPSIRKTFRFIGERINIDETPSTEDWKLIKI